MAQVVTSTDKNPLNPVQVKQTFKIDNLERQICSNYFGSITLSDKRLRIVRVVSCVRSATFFQGAQLPVHFFLDTLREVMHILFNNCSVPYIYRETVNYEITPFGSLTLEKIYTFCLR